MSASMPERDDSHLAPVLLAACKGDDQAWREVLRLYARRVFALAKSRCRNDDVAEEITKSISIPTIGIGAGAGCDGQVLVVNDLLGLTPRPPSFAKVYADLATPMRGAFEAFRRDVESGSFPG